MSFSLCTFVPNMVHRVQSCQHMSALPVVVCVLPPNPGRWCSRKTEKMFYEISLLTPLESGRHWDFLIVCWWSDSLCIFVFNHSNHIHSERAVWFFLLFFFVLLYSTTLFFIAGANGETGDCAVPPPWRPWYLPYCWICICVNDKEGQVPKPCSTSRY